MHSVYGHHGGLPFITFHADDGGLLLFEPMHI